MNKKKKRHLNHLEISKVLRPKEWESGWYITYAYRILPFKIPEHLLKNVWITLLKFLL